MAAGRKERRAQALAERKQRKKERAQGGVAGGGGGAARAGDASAWMASLLPMPLREGGGCVLEVGANARGTAALEARGWRVVAVEAAAVLAEGAYAGEPVDAVTCWLLEVPATERLRAMGMQSEDERRLAVLTLIYRLADRVLRPGGVLQVVERVREPFGESLAGGMIRLQRAQAKGTTLEFAAIDARPEGNGAGGGGGALVSVRSRKA